MKQENSEIGKKVLTDGLDPGAGGRSENLKSHFTWLQFFKKTIKVIIITFTLPSKWVKTN